MEESIFNGGEVINMGSNLISHSQERDGWHEFQILLKHSAVYINLIFNWRRVTVVLRVR